MVVSISHFSRKQTLLSFIFLLTFVIGILQVVPFVTDSGMHQNDGNITEADVDKKIKQALCKHKFAYKISSKKYCSFRAPGCGIQTRYKSFRINS